RATQEFNNELADPFGTRLAGLAAAAQPGRHTTRERAGMRLGRTPIETIANSQVRARPCRLLRGPPRDNVVVELVVGWNLDELHGAVAPVIERLDPKARPALVADAI